MKQALLARITQHSSEVGTLRAAIKKHPHPQVQKKALVDGANAVARKWFDEVGPLIWPHRTLEGRHQALSREFESLLGLARSSARKTTYERVLKEIVSEYQKVRHEIEIATLDDPTALSIAPYIEGLPLEENSYLAEAQRCLTVDGKKACIILGWCATIARIHEKLAALGFEKFNAACKSAQERTYGRFKSFNKRHIVTSISELQQVFDTDLLMVIEFMELIDSNQHERLRHCFLMRNNSAHPGKAPISGENLYSFYSDITKIVLKNPKFALDPESDVQVT